MKIINKTTQDIYAKDSKIRPNAWIEFTEKGFDTNVINSIIGSIIITTEYSKRSFDKVGCTFLDIREIEEKDSQGLPVIEVFEKMTDFNEYLQKQLKDPEFKEEFFKETTEEVSETALLTMFLETDYFEDDKLHGYRCANCGFSFTSYFIKCHNYCYNCGAINIDSDVFKKRRERNGKK